MKKLFLGLAIIMAAGLGAFNAYNGLPSTSVNDLSLEDVELEAFGDPEDMELKKAGTYWALYGNPVEMNGTIYQMEYCSATSDFKTQFCFPQGSIQVITIAKASSSQKQESQKESTPNYFKKI